MKKIVCMVGDRLHILTPCINTYPNPENITEDEALARAMRDVPEGATDIRVMDEAQIPADRSRRDQWKLGANGIE